MDHEVEAVKTARIAPMEDRLGEVMKDMKQQVPTRVGEAQCSRLKCTVLDCEKRKGGRGRVYIAAQKCGARYSAGVSPTEQRNVHYNEKGDLIVDLLFKTERDAIDFRNALSELSHPPLSFLVDVGDGDPQPVAEAVGLPVLEQHYDAKKSKSPSLGLHEVQAPSTLGTPAEPDTDLFKFQMLEAQRDPLLDIPEKAHIVPKPVVRKRSRFKDDDNNRLALYRAGFHTWYDGLRRNVIRIAILPFELEGTTTNHQKCGMHPCSPQCQTQDSRGLTRYKFDVVITVQPAENLPLAMKIAKSGSYELPKAGTFVSFVYVTDPKAFGKNLLMRSRLEENDDESEEDEEKDDDVGGHEDDVGGLIDKETD